MSEGLSPRPVDRDAPQATVRAILTGMLLAGALVLCNIYSGLKIGWSTNMSITAALLGFGLWRGGERVMGAKPFGILENNINQTAASAGASISSAGLVAPIPALAMITGQTLSWFPLALWVFSVAIVGIVVATGLRRQMLIVDELPFPFGVATAEMVTEMYAKGGDAVRRVLVLLQAAVVSALLKLAVFAFKIPKLYAPGALSVGTLKNLTIALDPSLLLVGAGALIGFRACASLAIGALAAWLFAGPFALESGFISGGAPDKPWFSALNKWLLWPGVAMMVTASLTSFAFTWKSLLAAFRSGGDEDKKNDADEPPRRWFWGALLFVLALSVILQNTLFSIAVWTATVGVLFTFVLAIVAARVSGETGITPVGPMGKVTQLLFGVIAPGSAASNLMAANVTGGAASQAGDLLHDLKCGLLLGGSPKLQAIAQVFGVMAGSTVGAAAYLVLVPNPKEMLLTEAWPAPAVAAWKAVAEIFVQGLGAMPSGALDALVIAGVLGVILAVLEKVLPKKMRMLVPSATSMGIAFVLPAYYCFSMFFGGLFVVLAKRYFPAWQERFGLVVAAGVIAGESLMGVGIAIYRIFAG